MKKTRKERGSLVGVALAALIVLVAAFLLRLTLHRPPEITLPEDDGAAGGSAVVAETGQDAVRRVEVTPDTVQRVIERLARPENYSRTIRVERFWQGGGGSASASVRVADGWMRLDEGEDEEEARHVIAGDGTCWIWYGAFGPVFTGAAAFSADEEQGIPTYEDILRLDTARIAAADYRAYDGVECVYVETLPDEAGYTGRYWVGVENGLLIAAERAAGETLVYRMTGSDVNLDDVTQEAFRLPDGELPLPAAG